MRFLLIHPWASDVAAFNFWVRPLGLYALAEWLWERGGSPVLVDCLSPAQAPGKFPRQPVPTPAPLAGFPRRFARYGIGQEEFDERIRAVGDFDAVLITSAISYWYPGIQWTVDRIRCVTQATPLILGGVYPTLWPDHARVHAGADHVIEGPLETSGGRLARLLGLPADPIRPRTPWYTLGLHDGASYAAIRTARGCPFRCSYCASQRLSMGFEPRPAHSVLSELIALSSRGITDIAFYDDALLVEFQARLLPVLQEVVRRGLRLRFHVPNGMHARFVTPSAAEWMARAGFVTIRLGLETTDPERQRETGGKVTSSEVTMAVGNLIRAGIPSGNIGVYLLLGLPGQRLEEIRQAMAFVGGLGVRPYLAEFSPIPGTREWDRLLAAGTLPAGADPLLTNKTVFVRRYSGHRITDIEDIMNASKNSAILRK